MKETVAAGPARAGLGIFSTRVRCGRSWGHSGGILDYLTLVSTSEKGDRVGVISVQGGTPPGPLDVSALVCATSR